MGVLHAGMGLRVQIVGRHHLVSRDAHRGDLCAVVYIHPMALLDPLDVAHKLEWCLLETLLCQLAASWTEAILVSTAMLL